MDARRIYGAWYRIYDIQNSPWFGWSSFIRIYFEIKSAGGKTRHSSRRPFWYQNVEGTVRLLFFSKPLKMSTSLVSILFSKRRFFEACFIFLMQNNVLFRRSKLESRMNQWDRLLFSFSIFCFLAEFLIFENATILRWSVMKRRKQPLKEANSTTTSLDNELCGKTKEIWAKVQSLVIEWQGELRLL